VNLVKKSAIYAAIVSVLGGQASMMTAVASASMTTTTAAAGEVRRSIGGNVGD